MGETNRPLGIVLIAVYSALTGVVAFPTGCVMMVGSGLPGAGFGLSLVSFAVMAMGVALLAATYGVWTRQSWGGEFTFWLYVALVPFGLLAIFPIFPGQRMSMGNTLVQLIGVAIDVAVALYLAKPEIKELFTPGGRKGSFDEFVRKEPH